MYSTNRLAAVLLSSASISVTFSPPASAQSATSADAAIPEIVVTGQKRLERVQDVPKQIAVASQNALATAGVTRITDLQAVFPTITATDQSQNSKAPGIRGIAPVANSIGVQAQTGIIVDDVPQSTFSTLANELTDIERVEVFAGPQSTLSGRNAAGGLINFVTRSPSRTPEYSLNVEQTTDRQTRVNAFLTGPLSNSLSYSLSLFYNKWSGNLRNALLSDDRLGGFNTKGVRAKLKWEPTDRLTATLTAYYIASKRKTPPLLSGTAMVAGTPGSFFVLDAQQRTLAQAYPGVTVRDFNREVYSPENGVARTRDRGATLRLDYDAGSVGTISSLTSYTYSSQPRRDILIGSPTDNFVINISDPGAFTDVRSKYFTQEVRLTSPDSGPFTYLIGAIYTDTHVIQPYIRTGFAPVNWNRDVTIGSAAIFGRGTLALTSSDFLTAGLRYQHDRLTYNWDFNPIAPTDSLIRSSGKNNYGFVGGEVSYRHEFSRDVSVYGTYSHSQTGRAYDVEDNGTAISGTLTPLESEKVDNWEIGLKSQFFNRRLTFNIDGFWADYSNYQIQTIDTSKPAAVPVIRLFAVGKVRTKGIEVTTALKATRDLTINAAGAYTRSEIRDFPNAACYTNQTATAGCVNGTQGNLPGLQLPFAPRLKFTLGADYSHSFSNFDFSMGAFYRYQSSEHFDVLGDPLSYQKGFGTLNVYAGPDFMDHKISLRLFVNNLFNKNYYSYLNRNTFFVDGTTGQSTVVNAAYDRNSFRYGGVRLSVKY